MILCIKMFCQIKKPSMYSATMSKQKAFGDLLAKALIFNILTQF